MGEADQQYRSSLQAQAEALQHLLRFLTAIPAASHFAVAVAEHVREFQELLAESPPSDMDGRIEFLRRSSDLRARSIKTADEVGRFKITMEALASIDGNLVKLLTADANRTIN